MNTKVTVVAGWCICPYCGRKTKTKVKQDTILKNFPLYCHWCKTETIVDYGK